MGLTFTYVSGSEIDNGITIPSNPVIPLSVTQRQYYSALNSASVPLARTFFTPEGSSSYQVASVVGTFNTVGSQSFMLVIASGSTQIGSGTPILASGIPTYPADTPQYGTLINSASLLTLAPGNALGVRGTLNGLDPEGVLEVVLTRIN